MVSTRKRPRRPRTPAWHATFLAMLPAIRRHAKIAFRHRDPEAREEAVQEVICNACCAVARLAELGKLNLAYPTVLARFAVAQVHDGRKVGCKLNVRDVLSPYCQRRKDVTVERLDRFDKTDGTWIEAVVEDPYTPVIDQVWFRIDFPAWLSRFSDRDRQIAEALAAGNRTGDVAREFDVSAGRISQMRKEFADSWSAFHGEEKETMETACTPA